MLKIDTHAHYLPRDWPDLAAQVRRRPLPGDPPRRRRPPPHLQGRQVLPRDLAQDLGPAGAHRRLRALRRAGAGDQHGAGDVQLLGQAAARAGPAPGAQRPHGRDLPRRTRGTTPASARCRCSRRAWPCRSWSAAWTSSTCRACRSARTSTTGTSTRRSCSRSSRRRSDLGAAILVHPWDMMGTDTDAEVLAALAGRHARRAVARGLLPGLRRRAGAAARS